MHYYLSDLLPYRKDFLITSLDERIKIVRLILFLCKSAKNAFKSFTQKHYQDFDAQVSDNLCQIRAYQLALMTDSNHFIQSEFNLISTKLDMISVKAELLLNAYDAIKYRRKLPIRVNIKSDIIFKSYLDEELLEETISEEQYFLIQTFILSRYKLVSDYEISLGINYQFLCDELLIASKTYAVKVIHHFQRNISKLSCSFIFKLLFDLQASPERVFLLNSLHYQDEIGRNVLACFEATKIIIEHALKSKKKACVSLTMITNGSEKTFILPLLFLDSNVEHRLYHSHAKEAHSAIFFKGIVHSSAETSDKYLLRFLAHGFKKIILCNMAQHSQYAGLGLDDKKYNPYFAIDTAGMPKSYAIYIEQQEQTFLSMKHLASQIGCTPENASLFLLTHVRCTDLHFSFQPFTAATVL